MRKGENLLKNSKIRFVIVLSRVEKNMSRIERLPTIDATSVEPLSPPTGYHASSPSSIHHHLAPAASTVIPFASQSAAAASPPKPRVLPTLTEKSLNACALPLNDAPACAPWERRPLPAKPAFAPATAAVASTAAGRR